MHAVPKITATLGVKGKYWAIYQAECESGWAAYPNTRSAPCTLDPQVVHAPQQGAPGQIQAVQGIFQAGHICSHMQLALGPHPALAVLHVPKQLLASCWRAEDRTLPENLVRYLVSWLLPAWYRPLGV